MLIKTLKNDYHIIQTISASEDINVYVAKVKGRKLLYILNEISNRELIDMYITDFLKLKSENEKSDFVDLVTIDSKLYIIFRYNKPNYLPDYLAKAKLSFEEKVKLVTNFLFEYSSACSLPLLVQKSLTDPENINIKSDGTIYFNYSLKPVLLIDQKDIFYGISSLIKLVFAKNLKRRKGEKLQIIIEKCNKSLYSSIPEIIKDMEKVIPLSLFGKIKKFFAKEENKRKLIVVRNVSLTVLSITAILIVYFKYLGPATEQTLNPKTPVTKIGDVSVYDDKINLAEPKTDKPVVISIDVN